MTVSNNNNNNKRNVSNGNEMEIMKVVVVEEEDYEEDDSSREEEEVGGEVEEEYVAMAVGCGENGKVAMEHIVWKQIYSQRESKKKELPWEKQRLVLDGTRVCCFGMETPETFGACPTSGFVGNQDQSTLLANAVARLRQQQQQQSSNNNKKPYHLTRREQMKKKKTFLDLQHDRVIVKGTVAGVELLPPQTTNSIHTYTTRIQNFLTKSTTTTTTTTNNTNETPTTTTSTSGVNRRSGVKKGFSPTPFELYLHSKKWNLKWRICFENERILREWMAALKCIKLQRQEDKKIIAEDHGFEPGDHIIRWELLPVAWPIQIHGIVLEAGKNCIIIADFGLTSYRRSNDSKKEEVEEEEEEKQMTVEELNFQDTIMKSFQSMRPKEKNRLNVITITDPSEIKKWTKVGYGKKSKLKPSGHSLKVPKWLSQQMSKLNPMATNNKEDEQLKKQKKNTTTTTMKPVVVEPMTNPNGRWSKHIVVEEEEDTSLKQPPPPPQGGRWAIKGDTAVQKRPPTIRTKKLTINPTNDTNEEEEENTPTPKIVKSSKKGRWKNKEMTIGQSTTGQGDDKEDETNTTSSSSSSDDLPDSDPAKIVLARTHFLLEYGDEYLPPYHILYSNSECIAVWCKTGQWSTLQASIFLTSSCIGNAKSATVLTMGAAAAHVVLLPAVAVGGLVWVTTPFVFLKKSKEMWDKATHKLNDLFWSHATPDIFVCAIEFYNQKNSKLLLPPTKKE